MKSEPRASHQWLTESPEETVRVGRELGGRLSAGTVVDLRGPLGAGKTQFVRGLAAGLGVERGVRSPTFTICHVHAASPGDIGSPGNRGRVSLYHIDAYRVTDPEELLLQGWDEMCELGIVAVEWGERVAEILPARRVGVTIEHCGPQRRRLSIEAHGARHRELVHALAKAGGSESRKQ